MINLFQALLKNLVSLMFFSRQYQPMSNDSTLPLTFSLETTNRLSNVNVRLEKISKIIQALDQNKAYGYDDISVIMI